MRTNEERNMAKSTVDIIVPTWNNPTIFGRMALSLIRNTAEPFRFIVVNNGSADNLPPFPSNDPRIVILQSDRNLGWMGGVNAGIKWAKANNPSKYVMWINDDIQVLDQDYGWLPNMISCFHNPEVGAVGPISNAIMGYQSFANLGLPPQIQTTKLSGMCMLTTHAIVDKVGLLDESLPGGDDLDYSMRLRKAGYKLCITRRTFLFHHYATTGKRVFGDYWDSTEHTEASTKALINKHGLIAWYQTVNDIITEPGGFNFIAAEDDYVIEALLEQLENGKVLDLGCGGSKVHPKAIGVDIRPSGVLGVGCNSYHGSAGDVACDITDLKPFADKSVDGVISKHILEHILDVPSCLREWQRVLKDDGKMVIIVPNYNLCEALSCDPSHVHAFTPESLKSEIESIGGFKVTNTKLLVPGYSIMVTVEKIKKPVASCSCHPELVEA